MTAQGTAFAQKVGWSTCAHGKECLRNFGLPYFSGTFTEGWRRQINWLAVRKA
jgi:hypothetical protein